MAAGGARGGHEHVLGARPSQGDVDDRWPKNGQVRSVRALQ